MSKKRLDEMLSKELVGCRRLVVVVACDCWLCCGLFSTGCLDLIYGRLGTLSLSSEGAFVDFPPS